MFLRAGTTAAIALICLLLPVTGMALGMDFTEVAPGIFVHQGTHALPDRDNLGEIANIGYIVGEKCVAVVDSGGSPRQGEALLASIRSRTTLPICYVVNTHVHPDHILGNKAFVPTGAIFVGHHKLAQAMATRAPFYRQNAARDTGVELDPSHFIPPNRLVMHTLDLDLGGRTLTLTAHPAAHTDNDLTLFDDRTRTLWLSDVLFLDHLPVVDGSLSGWVKVLDDLKQIKAARAIPGHGPVVVDWPQAADAETRYLEGLRNDVRTYVQKGRTMEQALDEVTTSAPQSWKLYDAFHKRNVSTAFAELEWED